MSNENLDFHENEREFFEETNNFRRNPQSVIPYLEALIPLYKENVLYKEGEVPIQTSEGVAAVHEAIEALRNAEALPEFELDDSLCKAARAHAEDIGAKGLATHDGTDGSTVSDRIERFCEWEGICAENIDFGNKKGLNCLLAFLVDDGVTNRGHRLNLLNPKCKKVGIAMSQHKDYEVCLVEVFVSNIREKDKPFFDIKTYKYKYPENLDQKAEPKQKKIKNQYQLEDEDAPDNTVSVRVVKQTKLYEGKVHRVTRKFYTLSDGTTTIVEVEDI